MPQVSGPSYGPIETSAAMNVLASGQLWRGNGSGWGSEQDHADCGAADRLEDAISERFCLPYVHAVNSGTSANEAAIASLGLQPGDEVICPAVSPVFVPFAVMAVGCIPVFADTDPDTLLVDPDSVEDVISEKSRALVAVHLWGIPAPMVALRRVADRYGLKIVEDCAQALGSAVNGRAVGTFGDAACFSFQQTKHITSGEGGAFATHSVEAYKRAVLYSNAGIPSFRFGVDVPSNKFSDMSRGHLEYGHNHRISELQAAVVLAQLTRLDEFIARRAELVHLIEAELAEPGRRLVHAAPSHPGSTVSYWRYPITVPHGLGTYRGVPYLEPAFRQLEGDKRTPFGLPIPKHVRYDAGCCPNAEQGVARIRPVPLHHGMTDRALRALVTEIVSDL